jgi:beta-N-acetylhexosaminidase
MTRRRAIGLAVCLMAVIATVAVASGGHDGRVHPLPEGGSSFRADTNARATARSTGLIEALAPVVADAQAAAGLPASEASAAARLFLVGFGGTRPDRALLDRVTAREWGGVVLARGNGVTPAQVGDLVSRIRSAAARVHHAAPMITAIMPGGDADAVPVGAPWQSAMADAPTAQRTALATARALHALGIRLVLGPVADLGVAGGPWEGRAFSDTPSAVTTLAAAATAGWVEGGVAPAPGHFPGEGAASGDPSFEPATVGQSLAELRRGDLQPFRPLVRSAPAIQLSAATYVAFDGVTPATLLPDVVGLLRRELRYDGVVISGDLAAASLATGQPVADLAVAALKAGCDLLWIPGDAADQDAAWRAVVRGLRTGAIPASRVADALRRVSVLRATYGVR